MSLVKDLIEEVIDSSSDLSQVLRNARLLASELRSDELRTWVEAEINGYPEKSTIPDYRVFVASNFGNFVGVFGRSGTGLPIPLSVLPKDWREPMSKLHLRSGIAALREIFDSETEYVQMWTADNIAAVSQDIYTDMNMIRAWKALPKADVASIFDAIRNRLLNFLLDLRENNPQADAPDGDLGAIPKEVVKLSIVNHIYGEHNYVASGETVYQQIQQGITSGDLASLLAALKEFSLPDEILGELPTAIDEDEPIRNNGIGPKVSSWLARLGENIATQSSVAFATQALLQYYGIAGA